MDDDRRVIVIGSGPGGATAAAFLCKAGIKVTLLEAGTKRGSLGLTARIGGMTIASRRKPLQMQKEGVTIATDTPSDYFEELSPGGLSNHWSCGVPRFSRDDFRDAQRAGERWTWPIGYDDLAPWYDKVEPLMHIAGTAEDTPQLPAGKVRSARNLDESWSAVAAEARRDGRDVVPMPYAYRDDTTLTLSGTAFNAYVRLVKPEERAGRIEVRYGARVLRLEPGKGTPNVEAVVFHDAATGVEQRMTCRAVVVAGGAINTAQILLSSKSDEYPDGLGNVHGVLGRYLHDHPLGKLVVDLDEPVSLHPSAYVTRPGLDRSDPLYAAACMQWSGASLYLRSLFRRNPGRLRWAGFSVFGTMAPIPEDRVELAPDGAKNPDGSSAIAISIRHPKEANDVLERTRDDLMTVFDRAGFAPVIRVWKVENPGNSNHYGGTCRMHASPEYGMLDSWGRIHGVPNVMVGDSSVFTTGPEKNPVLTSMALSARAADRLAQDLKSGLV